MQLKDALGEMFEDGFALWVGAGVTHWLSGSGGQKPAPLWSKLATKLEVMAGLDQLGVRISLPQRMQRVHRALGWTAFQAALREATLERAANSLLVASWRLGSEGSAPIPTRARQLARLGYLANPIVNFNIETLTSLALACAGGPTSIKAFSHPQPTESDAVWRRRLIYSPGDLQILPRHVYHPHGAIELSGICVMTESEYRTQEATLAFELATHSAFMSNLAIVGMSLEDAHLREQLSRFRRQIRQIFWFVELQSSPTSNEVAAWAAYAGIEVVDVGAWEEFWKAAYACLPSPKDLCLLNAWEFVCRRADKYLQGEIREIKKFMEDLILGEPLLQEIQHIHASQAAEAGEAFDRPPKKELTTDQLRELWAAFQRSGQHLAKSSGGRA